MAKHRTATPIIKALRNFLRGKKFEPIERHADTVSARTQPPPEIPGGPYHKTTEIYYFKRDARREVQPPIRIMDAQISSGIKEKAAELKYITPGKPASWT